MCIMPMPNYVIQYYSTAAISDHNTKMINRLTSKYFPMPHDLWTMPTIQHQQHAS